MAQNRQPQGLRRFEFATSIVYAAARWWYVLFLVVGGAMSSFVAWLTAGLAPYAPFSWLAAGILAATIMACALLAASKAAEVIARWNFTRKMTSSPPAFNPLDTRFDRQSIKLSDLRNPFNAIHLDKTFLDCELIGPAVLYFDGNTILQGVGFMGCDCVAVRENARVNNLIVLRNAVVRGGKIYGATLLFPHAMVERLNREIPGIVWVTN